MGSIVYTSYSYSSLVDKLCEFLVEGIKAEGPHETTVIIPNHTQANWLSNEIAQRLGVCLNVRFAYLDSLLTTHQETIHPTENSRLSWSLSILHTLKNLDENLFLDLQEESNAIQYCWEFSNQLEKYVEFRNEWTRDWNQIDHTQARWLELYNRCWQDIELSNLKNQHVLAAAVEAFNNPDAEFLSESRTIHLFGFWEFSPLRWNLLEALFPETNLITYLSLPTKTYLGDLTKSSLQLPLFSEEENILLNPRLKLLSKLSARGRGFQAFLLDHNVHVEQVAPHPSSRSNLGLLQRLLIDPEHSHKLRGELTPDQTIQLHSCTSKKRELEVVKAQIQQSIRENPDLKLEEIHVYAPNIEDYAEWIPVIFSEQNTEHALTFSIKESLEVEKIPVFRLLLDLLSIPQSNLSVTSVKSLLSHEAVKLKFKLSDDDIDHIFDWIDGSAIWGGEKVSEEDYSSPNNFYSWSNGLTRLLHLYANEDDQSIEAFPTKTSSSPFDNPDAFEAFLTFFRSIESLNKEFEKCRTHGLLLIDLIRKSLSEFIPEDYNTFEQSALQKTLSSLEHALENNPQTEISAAQLTYLLRKSLPQLPPPNSLSRRSGIQFSTIRYEEMIPGKLKLILGLQDGSFPRNEPQRSYDLIQQTESRFGDPSLRDQDLYWLLHTFVLAEQKWIGIFVGQDEFSNDKLPISPIIQTILETVNNTLPDFCGIKERSKKILNITYQPRFPYEAKNFEANSLSQHFDQKSFAAFKNLNATVPCSPFLNAGFTNHEAQKETLHLKELISFYTHPAKYFCKNSLKIDLATPPLAGEKTSEPLLWEEDFLQDYRINQVGLNKILSNEDMDTLKNTLKKQGILPIGIAGDNAFHQRQSSWNDYFEALPDDICFQVDKSNFGTEKISCGSTNLIIPVLNQPIQQIGLLSPGNLKKSSSIAVWIYALALTSGSKTEHHPQKIVHAGKDGSVQFRAQSDAQLQLTQLVEIWKTYNSSFLPFFPETSYVAYDKKYSPEKLSENPKWVNSMFGGEYDDPFNRIVISGLQTPFTPAFYEFAEQFYSMMELSLVTERKGSKQ